MSKRAVVLVLAGLMAGVPALAAESASVVNMQQQIRLLDQVGDGQISRPEAAARPKLVKYFDRIDSNRDGLLTKDELRALRKALLKEHLGG